MYRPIAAFLLLFLLPAALSGLDLSVSRKQFSGETHPLLPESFFMLNMGVTFPLPGNLDFLARGGHGSGTPEDPIHQQGVFIEDVNGRIWALETGLEYRFFQDHFILRGTAGRAFVLMDYVQNDSTGYVGIRHTESQWENTLSLGLGTGYSIMEFLIVFEMVGSEHSLVSGEIGLSF